MMAKYGSELSLESLSEMDVLHRNIQEALRLFPPLILLMRYAKEAFSVTTSKGAAITIPKVPTFLLACSHPLLPYNAWFRPSVTHTRTDHVRLCTMQRYFLDQQSCVLIILSLLPQRFSIL